MKIPFFESSEARRKRLAIAEAMAAEKASKKVFAKSERQKKWNAFWFQIKLAIAGMFAAFVGLVALVIYTGRGEPHGYVQEYRPMPASSAKIEPRETPKKAVESKSEPEKTVHVKAYDRKDGTHVKAHTRSK